LVILELERRWRGTLVMSPLYAEELAGRLADCAAAADLETRRLFLNEHWRCDVTNFDRQVVAAFKGGPIGGRRLRIPMPPDAARQIAGLLLTNASMAGHGLRIERG
jgi:hypothetical protein